MEKGYGWYRAGKLSTKKNTFTDFIACAEHLISEKYTSSGKIAAHGGSAGGMLMGAVVNMRPELFGAIVADVPFVDVLATILDDTLPLTPPEWVEWGNPIKDETARAYIASYSPYDNVTAQDYPAMLITGGISDPRVTYWEPAKWAAKLRATCEALELDARGTPEFARILREEVDYADRKAMGEAMWSVALADGHSDESEEIQLETIEVALGLTDADMATARENAKRGS